MSHKAEPKNGVVFDNDERPLSKILERSRSNVRDRLVDIYDASFCLGDSPIEKLLFTALMLEIETGYHEHDRILMYKKGRRFDPEIMQDIDRASLPLVVEAQVKVLDWPVDFLISSRSVMGGWSRLAIECDGHDFHERTKEQAKKDRSRDRRLQKAGLTVFRFTGSEIWGDPCACADQIIEWAIDAYYGPAYVSEVHP